MKLKLLISALALCGVAFGQAARFDSQAWTTATLSGSTGMVKTVPGAVVTVCTYPASTFGACVKAPLCPDTTLSGCSTASNPVTADASGNYGFWIAPGPYDYWITAFGVNAGPYHIAMSPQNGGVPAFSTVQVGTGGITGVPGANVGSGPIPLGNDPFMYGQGSADSDIGNIPFSLNSSTAVAGAGVHTITVSSTANYYTNIPSTPTTLQIEAIDAANHESLTAGTVLQCAGLSPPSGKWCIGSSTTIVANFTKSHSGTYPVWQYGAGLVRAYIFAHDAQDGSHLWFSQQDASSAPYYFHWALGNGTDLFTYTSGGKNWYGDNFLQGDGRGMLFNGNQTIIRTGIGDSAFVQDTSGAAAPMVVKSINGIKFADSFAGATVADKINAAMATCPSYSTGTDVGCTVVIPSTMACGEGNQAPDNVLLIDYRGCAQSQGLRSNISASTGGGVRSKLLLQDNWGATGSPIAGGQSSASLYVLGYVDKPESTSGTIAAFNATMAINTQLGHYVNGPLTGGEFEVFANSTNASPQTVDRSYGALANSSCGGNTQCTTMSSLRAQAPINQNSPTSNIANAYALEVDDVSGIGTANNASIISHGAVYGEKGLRPANGSAPACDATKRGLFWYVPGGAGVKDVVEVCGKDAADAYAWRAIY